MYYCVAEWGTFFITDRCDKIFGCEIGFAGQKYIKGVSQKVQRRMLWLKREDVNREWRQ